MAVQLGAGPRAGVLAPLSRTDRPRLSPATRVSLRVRKHFQKGVRPAAVRICDAANQGLCFVEERPHLANGFQQTARLRWELRVSADTV